MVLCHSSGSNSLQETHRFLSIISLIGNMAAETLLFNIADIVLGKLGSFALQEVCLAWGLKSELENLQSTISTIRAVLLDAEEQQEKNRQLTDWLGKIKDALYDAEDVFDEFQYEDLRKQAVNHGEIKRKVRNFLSRSNPLVFRFKMGHKIKGIREKLDALAAEKVKFHLTEQLVDRRVVHGEREMTHSFVRPSDVIGRDDDKENIVRQLLMHPSDGENVSTIAIVGIGGLGKTTFAQLVYNDKRVGRHFVLKIWVCVSNEFDVTKLIKEIIKSATGKNCDDLTPDRLQALLRGTLDTKRFLLVLDDMWNDDRDKWIKLRDLLFDGASGSKILVTTRSNSVASIMDATIAFNLKGLSHEHCLLLFVKWAFRKGEEKHYPNLLNIGEEIVKKCRGIPLAVRTLGSLLYLKTDEDERLFIKNNEIWKLEQKKDDILPALRLSYDQMPSYLRQCFVFCSIFPKDLIFNSRHLIQFWIAEGFIPSSVENQDSTALRYLKELLSMSCFQDVENEGIILSFKMHDLVHDLALLMAKTEYCSINSRTHNISKRVRHISFSKDAFIEEEKVQRSLLQLDNVRTIIGEELTSESFMETCISRFKYLRVLSIRQSHLETLSSSIGKLKHLRLLAISSNCRLRKLPYSICKLLNLQVLVLVGCSELEELPKDIGNLICLRTLAFTTKQNVFPAGEIGRLISLQDLIISECHNLKSLGGGWQRLIALRYFHIYGCESLEDSLPLHLKYLTTLETLYICNCEKLNLMEQEEEGGDSHGIKSSLKLIGFKQLPQLVTLPYWLLWAAHTLRNIKVEDCCNLAALPEWLQNFTSLHKLQIMDCPKLLALPEGLHRLSALRELIIARCPELSRRCQQDTGEDWPKIAHIQEITIDGKKIKSIDN